MSKTSTNNANSDCSDESLTEDLECSEELDEKDYRFYMKLSSRLNLIQIYPKEETILKIIAYSKNKNNSSI